MKGVHPPFQSNQTLQPTLMLENRSTVPAGSHFDRRYFRPSTASLFSSSVLA